MNSQTAASDDLIAGIGDGEPTRENRVPQTDEAPAKTLAQKLLTVAIVLLFVSATISWIGFLGWAAWRLLNVNP
jgi:hypothetical protein